MTMADELGRPVRIVEKERVGEQHVIEADVGSGRPQETPKCRTRRDRKSALPPEG
jgi:hypothetical protein